MVSKKNTFIKKGFLLFAMMLLFAWKGDVRANETSVFTTEYATGKVLCDYKDTSAAENTQVLFLTENIDTTALCVSYPADKTLVSINGKTPDEAECGYVTDPVAHTFTLNASLATDYTVVLNDAQLGDVTYTLRFMQSDLPSLYIDLADGTTLDAIHAGSKDVKYTGNTVSVTDSTNAANNLTASDVELKGRGNSTWEFYDKKPYQIKFKKKTSVLGMDAAKKWVLLANASDASMMRNKLVFDTAAGMDMGYVPESEYADLWIEGEYLGTYLVAEKVEIGSGRLELDGEDALLMEQDNDFYDDEEFYFKDPLLENYYVLKDYNGDDGEEALESFRGTWEDLVLQLYAHRNVYSYKDICKVVDVDSFAKWYVVNEYFANNEATSTGFFMYQNEKNGKISAGPIWDFDSAIDSEDVNSFYVYNHKMLGLLLERGEFRTLVNKTYQSYKNLLRSASKDAVTLQTALSDSANMNYTRWHVLGTTDTKGNTFLGTYAANVGKLSAWLAARPSAFTRASRYYTPVYAGYDFKADVADDYSKATLSMEYDGEYSVIWFGVWTTAKGNDNANGGNLHWYPASHTEGTTWKYEIPLGDFSEAGWYTFVVYGEKTMGSGMNGIITMQNYFYVSEPYYAPEPEPEPQPEPEPEPEPKPISVVAMYRVYNPNSGEHFYTADTNERDFLVEAGWQNEGIGWYAPEESGVPVYRLYNPNAGDHHYTLNSNEKDQLVSVGWSYEGIGWYSGEDMAVPIYRLYNPNALEAGAHHYTYDYNETRALILAGWKDENIGWYGCEKQ